MSFVFYSSLAFWVLLNFQKQYTLRLKIDKKEEGENILKGSRKTLISNIKAQKTSKLRNTRAEKKEQNNKIHKNHKINKNLKIKKKAYKITKKRKI